MSDLSRYLADAKGDRSIDDIAKRATESGHPLSRSVVAKYLRGEHGTRPPEETLQGLAAGLQLDVRELRRLAGRPPGELGQYTPTPLSASLTQEQRDALDNLIRAFVSEGGQHDGRQPDAEKTPLTTQGDTTLAAHQAPSDGKIEHGHASLRGEESQDDGGMDPA